MATPAPTPEQIAYLRSIDKDDKRSAYIIGNAICLAAAYISVVLRFLSRRLSKTTWGSDDYTILAGLLLVTTYAALLFSLPHYGMGRHVIWMTNVKGFSQISLAAETMYNVAIPAIKTSILFLYRRIFPQRWFRQVLVVLGAFIVAYSLAQVFGDIFQCVPISSLWGESKKKYCIDYPALIVSMGVVNVVTDVIMLALPIPVLWSLRLSTSRKRLLTALFLMGGFVCIVSIVRLFYVQKVGNTKDPGWDYVVPSTLSNLECCVGIISACLPTYRPLVTSLRPSKRGQDTTHTSKAGNAGGSGRDSLRIPLRSLIISQKSQSQHERLDDEEQFFTEAVGKWTGHEDNKASQQTLREGEIAVTKSFTLT